MRYDEGGFMENKFTKESLVRSRAFRESRDILSAVLDDGKEYTKDEAVKMISDYLNKEMK